MGRLKKTYLDATNKHVVLDFLLEKYKFENIVGLAGPDINEYLEKRISHGYKNFQIFENDATTAVTQLLTLKKTPINLVYGDILEADADKPNTLYDLDFCASVRYLTDHIAKFKNNFIMTFSTRVGVQETIDTFFEARNETIVRTKEFADPIEHTIFTTKQGKYLFTKYFDTSAMCCFAKI